MDQYNEDRRRTIENASLLWTLAEVPEKPAENSIVSVEGEWTLPITREAQLTDDLAFIAAFRDNSNEIIAVGVEEGIDRNSTMIRVASNAGDLPGVVQNLQGVAELMVRASRRGIDPIYSGYHDCADSLYRCVKVGD